ncbi:MAG: putative oxidoreductase [Solirubrobacteraceae bacterium]|jgi:putative oxidoreductase|nr:putative oxidoreductase [Solirubrobacteraceae bacterium]MEA2300322.1 putative oxidoreductase [Solirubrobacteraceae bacterium]MEA2355273.1 putative oxidoreductase [Solirubrobacteraceae bacterium]
MSNTSKPRRRSLGRVIPRLIIGTYFMGHGAQKQFGLFGGHGLEATGAHFEMLGLKPGSLNAQVAAAGELGGGALLALGVLPTVAGVPLIATMVVAMRTVHLEHGPWLANGGFEYNLALIAAVMAIIDANTGSSFKALTALIGGAAASTAVIEMGKRS